jgi:hypothetical protein
LEADVEEVAAGEEDGFAGRGGGGIEGEGEFVGEGRELVSWLVGE